jgi:hypothetical protein
MFHKREAKFKIRENTVFTAPMLPDDAAVSIQQHSYTNTLVCIVKRKRTNFVQQNVEQIEK